MKVRFIKPHPLLSAYVERYWSWESEDEAYHYMPHVSPGTGADLYFHYRQPFNINGHGVLPASHLIHSGDKSCRILPASSVGFITVRFRCAMLGNFTKMPVYELADSFADAGTIWNVKGRQLERQMAVSTTLEERARLLDLFLLRQLDHCNRNRPEWKSVAHELYYNHEEVRLDQLAAKMKITPRHFRRAFREVSGMTPKHFQQLSRFHAVLKPLLINKNTKYLPVALDKGYFDQMHFIKEFKRFMTETPSGFLTTNNFRSHFYYTSW
jgi:AraC-like DNA-binding protein